MQAVPNHCFLGCGKVPITWNKPVLDLLSTACMESVGFWRKMNSQRIRYQNKNCVFLLHLNAASPNIKKYVNVCLCVFIYVYIHTCIICIYTYIYIYMWYVYHTNLEYSQDIIVLIIVIILWGRERERDLIWLLGRILAEHSGRPSSPGPGREKDRYRPLASRGSPTPGEEQVRK